MERVAGDVQDGHLGITPLEAFLVGAGVEHALALQARLGRGRADQLDDGDSIGQRSSTPVLRDVAEQAVLYSVPLRCSGRIVMDVQHEARLVGELLQLDFPEPHARAVRAAAVGRYRQLARLW